MPDFKKRTESDNVVPLRSDGALSPRSKRGAGIEIEFDPEADELIAVGPNGPRRVKLRRGSDGEG